MSTKQKLFFIIAFSVLGLLYILTKIIQNQNSDEINRELIASKERFSEAKKQEAAAIDLKRYIECNQDKEACDKIYPEAAKKVKAAIEAAKKKDKEEAPE